MTSHTRWLEHYLTNVFIVKLMVSTHVPGGKWGVRKKMDKSWLPRKQIGVKSEKLVIWG